MRKFLITLSILACCRLVSAQERNDFTHHQITVDFGSYRNRYLYPITDLRYASPVLKKVHLRFSFRMRSYGTLYFYSRSAYDLTPCVEYVFAKQNKPIYFSAGVGLDARLRLVHDERSDARSSVEPLLSLAGNGSYKNLSYHLPLWTRFYVNGISFAILPEAAYKIKNRCEIFLRYELTYMSVYKSSAHEWRRDCFIGTHILL